MQKPNKTNLLVAGLLLFAVAFLVSRFQFFACPTVEISNDSGEYISWIDTYIARGEMPPNNYIPIGYPLIIKGLTLLKDSIYAIVYFQIALTFISFCLLLFVVWRFYDKTIFYAALVCIALYVQIPNNLYYDIYLLSESVYNSSLVLLVAALIYFIQATDKKSAAYLSLALAAPILFRPTGIFTAVIFLLLLAYLVFEKRKDLMLHFIVPFSVIYLSLSVYCLVVSGTPNFIGGRAQAELNASKVLPASNVADTTKQ